MKCILGNNFIIKLEWIIVNEKHFSIFHNTQIQTAIEYTGLELISDRDFNERNLYDFFNTIQYQLDNACQVYFEIRTKKEKIFM